MRGRWANGSNGLGRAVETHLGMSDVVEELNTRSSDFGGMIRRMPRAVATPRSAEELTDLVRKASRDGTRLAVRGGGHSQGGQCLTDGGLVIDTMYLDRIEIRGDDLVRTQGGTPWSKVVDALRGTGRLPRVLVDIGEATVGGTLSAGGLGTASFRHGLQVDQVERLDVVTGTGERVVCSRSRNAALFDAVRGGQGQFGVIVEAWIRLRRAGSRIRQYQLLYRDFDRFADDFERVVGDGRFDHLKAETRLHTGKIIMAAGIEYDDDVDDGDALRGLGHDDVTSNDAVDVGRAGIYPAWGFSRRNHHPWRDWFLPWSTLRTLIAQPWLTPRSVPRAPFSWTGVYPIRTAPEAAPLVMRPQGNLITSYSILAVLGDHDWATRLTGRLREIDRTLVGLGAKSYLSGHVAYAHGGWEEHYGDQLALAKQWKREFDPNGVFEPNGLPFG